jgi:hypothetical protein
MLAAAGPTVVAVTTVVPASPSTRATAMPRAGRQRRLRSLPGRVGDHTDLLLAERLDPAQERAGMPIANTFHDPQLTDSTPISLVGLPWPDP